MKKIVKFFAAFVIFLFIFTACSGKGNSGKQEISDDDSENQVSDKDELSDDDPENQTPEEVNCKADGSEEFLTFADIDYGGCRGRGCVFRGISRESENEKIESGTYKLDGNILWFAHSYKGLVSVDVSDPKNPKMLASLKIKGSVTDMYFHKGTAFVIVKIQPHDAEDSGKAKFAGESFSKIIAVDISDPSKPSVSGEIKIIGWDHISKRIGDILYIVAHEYEISGYEHCDNEPGMPSGHGSRIMSINLKDPKNMKIADKNMVDGLYNEAVYISEKSIYVTDVLQNQNESHSVTMFDVSSGDGKIVKKAEFQTVGAVIDNGNLYEKGDVFYAVTYYPSEETGNMYIIESFDVSDPADIKSLAQFTLDWGRALDTTIFDGDRLYAVFYNGQAWGLEIFDISDPSNFKEFNKNMITLPNQSKGVAVKGDRFIAIGKNNNLAEIEIYDLSDSYIRSVKYLTFGLNIVEYWKEDSRPLFQVYDDFVLVPVVEYNEFRRSFYRLYIVGLDIEKGLEMRGFIEDESLFKRGVALKDSVLAISDSHLVSANIPKSGKPEVVSKLVLAEGMPQIKNCDGYLCGFLHPEFRTYNPENGELLWKSGELELPYQNITTMKNRSRAYIYGDISSKEKPYNEILKVLEFSKDGIFKESDFKSKDQFPPIKMAAVSENNIVAFVTTREEKQLSFLDIDDLENGIKQLPYHFDFDWISRIIVNGNTFWVSWCKYQDVDYKANHEIFRCYAAPVDVGDPNNPKAGAQINIPGFLSGIGSNGRYLYTETFEIQGRGQSDSIHDIYILELNADKTGVCVIKKETVEDYTYEKDLSKTTWQHGHVYWKNNGVILVSDAESTLVEGCSYTNANPSTVKIISAKGEEVFNKTFEGEKFLNDVRDGGFLVLTDKNWTYITPDGKEKTGVFSDDIDTSHSFSSSQLIDGKIYLPVRGSGIVTLDVK